MDNSLSSRFKKAWNVFSEKENPDSTLNRPPRYGMISGNGRPDRRRFTRGNERSIVNAIYNRIALDVAAVNIRHVQLDEHGRYAYDLDDELNKCLNLEANIDQTGRSFLQDVTMSLLDEGSVAIVPVDTDIDIRTGSFKILTMRTAKIVEWSPSTVKLRMYNDRLGKQEELWLPKDKIGIIENPLYSVMNEPNSTLQRLIRKLNLLDSVDESNGSAKLDLIIQLPYAVKNSLQKDRAADHIDKIKAQLEGSEYGIAYIDSTEKITQLNRTVESNLLPQIQYLQGVLYGQLGISQQVFDGVADEKAMLNYTNRTIEPIVSAISDELKRKFLTKTARTQGQSIMFFKDPFKLVPVDSIAEIADKFTRNEIMTSNEIRGVVGFAPSDDPKADELRNSNLSEPNPQGNEGNLPEDQTELGGQ